MPTQPTIDYEKLAREHGGTKITPPAVDYAALAHEVSETEPDAPDRDAVTRRKDAGRTGRDSAGDADRPKSLQTAADLGIGPLKVWTNLRNPR